MHGLFLMAGIFVGSAWGAGGNAWSVLDGGDIRWGQAGELPAISVFVLFLAQWITESRFHTQGGNDESSKII